MRFVEGTQLALDPCRGFSWCFCCPTPKASHSKTPQGCTNNSYYWPKEGGKLEPQPWKAATRDSLSSLSRTSGPKPNLSLNLDP